VPQTKVLFYREVDGRVPVRDWLAELQRKNRKAFAKCVERIQRLAALGHELRRPHADILRDGIYELRVRQGRVHYRILYSFHGRNRAVLVHALTKEGRVPDGDIDLAVKRMKALEQNPEAHIYQEDQDGQTNQNK